MAAGPPVSETLRRLGASVLALGRIRLELLAIEIQEEKQRLAALLFWAVLAALLAGFGLVFVALWLTVAFWDGHRLVALGAFSLVFVAGCAAAALRLRSLVRDTPPPFQASLGELRDDAGALARREPP